MDIHTLKTLVIMATKVDFELLKQTLPYLEQIVNINLSHLHGSNIKRFFETLSKSSTFAHLAHKQLSKPQSPFDKIEELWDEWNTWLEVTPLTLHKSFEFWLIQTNENFYDCTFIKEVHLILCNECGFATTAEVRRAIQELNK